MKLRNRFWTLLFALGASCIDNNLPYHVVAIDILGVEGEGFTVTSSDIDPKERVVTLRLDETTDISRVKITDVKITEGGKSSVPLTGTFDLRSPLRVTLSLYQDYEWEIRAEQEIERIFTVEGQIGSSVFDVSQRTATAQVSLDTDLSNITVTELKLGPRDITAMDPEPEALTDFSSVRYVDIAYHDFTERWRLYVVRTNEAAALAAADLWNCTATLSIAPQPEAETVALEYKRQDSDEWRPTEVAPREGGGYTASIAPDWSESKNASGLTVYTIDPASGVFAGTTYDYRLLVDGQTAAEGTFSTATGDTIPLGGMEESGMSCFTTENKTSDSWASGNNTFTKGLCTQSAFEGMEGAHCARLAGTTAVGILAAGNLFTGIFYKDGLTTGVVEFGQPYTWTARPSALKVKYYAEKIGTVDVAKHAGAPIGMGDQDRGRIFVAIVDWSGRHKVTSGTAAPTGTWDPEQQSSTDEGRIIGYGSMFIDESSAGGAMIETSVPLSFYDRQAKPSGAYTLVISCSTSAYGDFMVGCKTNVLYVDDFRWEY